MSGYTWGHQGYRGLGMLGERADQRGLWEADRLYLDHAGQAQGELPEAGACTCPAGQDAQGGAAH